MSNFTMEEKDFLTLKESSEYFNIGINKMREISDRYADKTVLWVGNKRLIKKKPMKELLFKLYSI